MIRKPFLIAVWSAHRFILLGLIGLLGLNILQISILHFGVSQKLMKSEKELSLLQQQSRGSGSVAPMQSFAQGQKDYVQFLALLPSLRNFSELIGDLDALANQCNLEISQIGYTKKDLLVNGVVEYTLKFSLNGTYDELKKFIYGLEESKRLIVIEHVTLNADNGGEGTGLVNLSINLTTYFGTETKE